MSAITHNAICHGCHKRISSIRYKCKQCEEFNFCTTCRGTKSHISGHSYFTIGGSRICSICRKFIDANDRSTRHFKCFSCLEYDLCENCKKNGSHNQTHRLLCVEWRSGMLYAVPADVGLLGAQPLPSPQRRVIGAAPSTPISVTPPKGNFDKPIGPIQKKANLWKPVGGVQGRANLDKPIGAVPLVKQSPDIGNKGTKAKIPSELLKTTGIEIHINTSCSDCRQSPIRGIRFKCSKCANFDLCENCKTRGVHNEHQFYPIKSEVGRKTQTSVLYSHWETDRNLVQIGAKIGQGSFGEVHRGSWKNMPVAIKLLQPGTMEVKEFLAEAELMTKLKHSNILPLLAVVTRKQPILIITDFMDQGSLSNYLHKHDKKLPVLTLIWISMEVADGMRYLESEKYVHRDLAARNVLVGTGDIAALTLTIKICDFGLTRLLTPRAENATLIYKSTSDIFPMRWTAPEAMSPKKEFTVKSDVWSFGILLTEIVTFGRIPYSDIPNERVENHVKAGNIMNRPVGCSESLYTIMKKTWSRYPRDRPSFKDILPLLQACFQEAQ